MFKYKIKYRFLKSLDTIVSIIKIKYKKKKSEDLFMINVKIYIIYFVNKI